MSQLDSEHALCQTREGHPPISRIPTTHSPDSDRPSRLGGESHTPPSTPLTTFACTLPAVGDSDEAGGDSFTGPISHNPRSVRVLMAVPAVPRENCRREVTTKKPSWRDIASGRTLLVGRLGEHVGSEAMNNWNSLRSSMESGTAVSTNSLRTLCVKEAEDNPDPYDKLGLAYIPKDDRHRCSWASNSPWYSGPPPGQEGQKLRSEEWMFRTEKADAPGPRLSGLTAGGVAAPTIGPGLSEIWRCRAAGRFIVESSEFQCSSRIC